MDVNRIEKRRIPDTRLPFINTEISETQDSSGDFADEGEYSGKSGSIGSVHCAGPIVSVERLFRLRKGFCLLPTVAVIGRLGANASASYAKTVRPASGCRLPFSFRAAEKNR